MAKLLTEIQHSDKTFGGLNLPEGEFTLTRAVIYDDSFTSPVTGEEVHYHRFVVHVKPKTGGDELSSFLTLNKCWVERRDKNGKAQKPAGTFYEQLLTACKSESFSATRDWINTNWCQANAPKSISVKYERYENEESSTGFSYVPIVNFI